MSFIYVLSNPFNIIEEYKVGSHYHTLSKLIGRYITSFRYVQINYFIYHPQAEDVESQIKAILYNYRMTNRNGSVSEWISLPLDQIIKNIANVINGQNLMHNETCVVLPADNDESLYFYWRKYILNIKDGNLITSIPKKPNPETNQEDEELIKRLKCQLGDTFKCVNIHEVPDGPEYDSHRELIRATCS